MVRSLVRYIHSPQWHRQHEWRKAVWQAMGNMGLTGLHGWPLHESWVEFAHVPMPIRGLSAGMVGWKVVQISDLHYSPFVSGGYLEQYVKWINRLKPAVVVATGDLFMGGRRYARKVAELLGTLRPTHGVLSIMGNHDYGLGGKAGTQSGLRRAEYLERVLESSQVRMLRNERWVLKGQRGARLTFVGLDEEWAGQMRPDEAFGGMGPSDPAVCLVHNPAYCLSLLEYPWQWMLTGHTHGRQLAAGPIGKRLYPGKQRRFTHGLYRINGRYLYVNRGLSYGQRAMSWCRPEITVFELRAAR